MTSQLTGVVFAVALLAPRLGAAAPRVLVLPAVKGARIAPSARDTQRALEDGLGARRLARWSTLRRSLLAAARTHTAASNARTNRVAAAIDDAGKDYVAQRFAAMRARLEAAEAAHLAQLVLPDGRAQAVLLNRLLAIAAIAAHDDPGAVARFRLMLALDGKASVDAALYPPEVIARFTQVRADVGKLPPSPLHVAITPADAELLVDGRRRDGEALKLTPGLHYVRVRALGYRDDVRRIEVKAGVALRVALVALADDAARRVQLARVLAAGDLDATVPGVCRAVARAVGATGVLVWSSLADGRLRVGYVASGGTDGRHGNTRDRAARNLPASAAARAYDIVAGGAVVVQRSPAPRSTPLWRRWWVWTLAGAVVAGAVTATVLATQLQSDTALFHFGRSQGSP